MKLLKETTLFYNYKLLSDMGDPHKEYYQCMPNFIHTTTERDPNNPTSFIGFSNLSTNSENNPFHNESGTFNYPYVTISYGGSNFENGGKEMVFNETSGQPANEYTYIGSISNDNSDFDSFVNTGDNGTFRNSVLSQETIFDKNLFKIKRTNYEYSYETNGFDMSNIKPYSYCNDPSAQTSIIFLHKIKSYKYKQTATITTDFVKLNIPHPEITTIVTKEYDPDKVSLPKSITTTTSDGIEKKTNLYYPSDVLSIGNLSPEDAVLLTQMQANHNLVEVVKMESYANNVLLDTKQVFYSNFGSKILPHIIQSKKGDANDPNVLEDRVYIDSYNETSKPNFVKLANGTYTEYVYNSKQQVILKIENSMGPNGGKTKPIDEPIENPCKYQNEKLESMVTAYNYDPVTNNLISIVDPKCDVIYYEYDGFNRLKLVRDKNGRILSENEYHYKP